MEKLDINISRPEVLRYLGYRGGIIDGHVAEQIDAACDKVLASIDIKYIYAACPLDRSNGLSLKGTVFTLTGKDICLHLKGCHSAIIMAVTLGENLDTEIRRTQISDMTLATIMDAAADAAVESACSALHSKLERGFAQKHLTGRFSPGYGDMPLSQQEPLCRVLDTERRIGLRVNNSFVLFPQKSVTALIGISDSEIIWAGADCEDCNLRQSCEYRKAGKTCAK
jgi:Methionine synthase I, cobalamin-binding domain